MKKRIVLTSSLLLGLSLILIPSMQARKHAQTEPYGIADREMALEKKISAAYGANQLTLEQTDDLKGKLKKIKDKEQHMKDKNGGKLSYADTTSLEKSLNSVSTKLHEKMLEKEFSKATNQT